MRTLRLITLAALLGPAGCSIRHQIARDFPTYLGHNAGAQALPALKRAGLDYRLTESTLDHHYEFRAASAGWANVWEVDFGDLLQDYLESEDARTALRGLKAAAAGTGPGGHLVFDLKRYVFSDMTAHVDLKVTLTRDGKPPLSRTYGGDGESQGGKVFMGGAWAMKNAVQSSTKQALDAIFGDLVDDLNKLP